MRISCNGCRVLRKGCSDSCSIRPCLDWIKSPESQANATVFLAKFYGRAGLMNLINAAPQHLRPSVFKSLLYDACGRIVNPINGSVGLLWSGSWQLCQNAVEAVLAGAPIAQMAINAAEFKNGPPLKVYDIRHIGQNGSIDSKNGLHGVRSRGGFKKGGERKRNRGCVGSGDESVNLSPSHESSLSHQSEAAATNAERESESLDSADTGDHGHRQGLAEPADVDSAENSEKRAAEGAMELDLTLGFEPFKPRDKPMELKRRLSIESAGDDGESLGMELRLDYPAS